MTKLRTKKKLTSDFTISTYNRNKSQNGERYEEKNLTPQHRFSFFFEARRTRPSQVSCAVKWMNEQRSLLCDDVERTAGYVLVSPFHQQLIAARLTQLVLNDVL
jgi:hypothetical protein